MKPNVYSEPGCKYEIFNPGIYSIFLYGAQGGQCGTVVPYGGHAFGILQVESISGYYICVGGSGSNTTTLGGVNGGGSSSQRFGACSGSGGGQTDIRTNASDPDTSIIVASGGGGDGSCESVVYNGGKGGGEEGADGKCTNSQKIGTGGSLTDGYGKGGYFSATDFNDECKASDGSRGKGGDACSSAGCSSGGGGAGYYGGGGGADISGGGGGSGYLSLFIKRGGLGVSNKTGNGIAIIKRIDYIITCKNNNIIFHPSDLIIISFGLFSFS